MNAPAKHMYMYICCQCLILSLLSAYFQRKCIAAAADLSGYTSSFDNINLSSYLNVTWLHPQGLFLFCGLITGCYLCCCFCCCCNFCCGKCRPRPPDDECYSYANLRVSHSPVLPAPSLPTCAAYVSHMWPGHSDRPGGASYSIRLSGRRHISVVVTRIQLIRPHCRMNINIKPTWHFKTSLFAVILTRFSFVTSRYVYVLALFVNVSLFLYCLVLSFVFANRDSMVIPAILSNSSHFDDIISPSCTQA